MAQDSDAQGASSTPSPDPWPTRIDEVEAAWLSAVVTAGQDDPVEIASLRRQRVGTGQVGECWRVTPVYARGEGPSSLIVKVAASDPTSRAAGTSQRCYLRETGFYRDLQATVGVRAPRCWFVALAPDETDHVLVLEDMAPARQGDQIEGCSVEQAAAALVELGRLQGPRWNDGSLQDIDWLERPGEDAHRELAGLVATFHGPFLERYGDRLDDDVRDAVIWLADHIGGFGEGPEGPLTLVHNDYRLDNMLFGDGRSAPPVTVVDWQTLKLGSGPSDAAYFIGGGLPAQARRAHEERLLRDVYHATLLASGVRDYPWERCLLDYRRAGFGGLIMAMVASMLVGGTERGDRMFLTMARRHARHALDLGTREAILA